MPHFTNILILLCALLMCGHIYAAETVSTSEDAASSDAPVIAEQGEEIEGAEEPKKSSGLGAQIKQGGSIVMILILLSVFMLTVVVERIMNLQRNKFVPSALSASCRKKWDAGDHAGIIADCEASPSTLSSIIGSLARYKHVTATEASILAGDIASQDMRGQMQKVIPFALIATISPLLGLLGTVSGMIAAFDVVAVAGSLGDASLLAGGISHALITTAAGLIVAVPAIAFFNLFKVLTNKISFSLETEVNSLINEWFLAESEAAGAE
ncbi:MAG: MotA/TolQ/ExbB proton channel family protein [Planctomycetes bacterium]|nr:MotA/TolQ/ExbB proton channel family protein [Planctomycetota bacterium]